MTTTPTSLPPLIPRDILFGDPVKSAPRISPDATMLAYIAPLDGVLNIWIGRIDEDPDVFEPITRDTDRGIHIYFWSEDAKSIIYLQDVGGNENWRLHCVDVNTKSVRDLTPFENVQARVLGVHRDHPDEMLIALNKDDVRLHDAYHLKISTGELTKIAANPGNFVGWLIDADFKLRGASAMMPDGGSQLLIRDPDSGTGIEWSVVRSWDADNALTSRPAGFTKDASAIYVIDSTDANAGRLTLLHLGTSKIDIITEDPLYDAGGVTLQPITRKLQAVTFTRETTEWEFFDTEFEEDFVRLSSIQDGEVSMTGRDRDDKIWLVAFFNDTNTTTYYLFHRETRQHRFLFAVKPQLDEYILSQMLPIEFESRDGLTIHGYLTLPVGLEPTNLPLVLDVHGGPWSRDTWGLNSQAQMFANRGYAVLQVNYRGSTGYGKDFVNAGDREWGAKMHDDLIDAVNWAIEQGTADPKKIAIYGGSYGGYAALVGATFTPDLFCCAVDIVGPSNLSTLIQSIPPYWQTMISVFNRRVGNPETDEEFLKSRSPLFKVDQIKIPMLIAQGANDPRVKQAESDQIVEAMKAKGIDYEYLVFEDEGHGFVKPENRLKFYAAADRFLAAHLGGRYEE